MSEPMLTLVRRNGVHGSEKDVLEDFWACKDFIVIGPPSHPRWGRPIHGKQIEEKTARILYEEQGNMCLVDKFCTVELPEDNTHRLGGCGFMSCENCRDTGSSWDFVLVTGCPPRGRDVDDVIPEGCPF